MNTQLFITVNSWAGRHEWLDMLMIFFAEWLGYILIALLVFVFIKNRQRHQEMFLVSLGSALIARYVFVNVIRLFYYNPRPFLVTTDIVQLVNHETTSSFPSGHASFYFALAIGVYLYNKKAGRGYLISAGLIGFARVWGGVHWPLDIVAGALLGIATAMLAKNLKEKLIVF